MLGAITCTAEMRPNPSFHRTAFCAGELKRWTSKRQYTLKWPLLGSLARQKN